MKISYYRSEELHIPMMIKSFKDRDFQIFKKQQTIKASSIELEALVCIFRDGVLISQCHEFELVHRRSIDTIQ